MNDYKVITTDLQGDSVDNIDGNTKFALVVGNEGFGINEKFIKVSDYNVKIDTSNVESLNVSIATSILMYELNKEI